MPYQQKLPDMGMKHFDLWWDEAMTKSWYDEAKQPFFIACNADGFILVGE